MLFAYILWKANIILMDITHAELGKLTDELLEGIRRVAHPSNIKKVVLEVGNLDEMISYRWVVDELAKRLGRALDYPILTRVRDGDRLIEGEYVIRASEYLAQGKKNGLATLGNPVDASRKCDGKDE